MSATLLSPPPGRSAAVATLPLPAASDVLQLTVEQLLLAALARARDLTPTRAGPPPQAEPPPPPAWLAHATALTGRECEVLQHLALGDCNKSIARALNLSPHTVKRHVANILQKLDVHSRGQAAAWWRAQQPSPHPRDGREH